MRIVLYSSTSRIKVGGVQAVYASLASGLRRRGHTVFEAWSSPKPGGAAHEHIFPLALPRTWRGLPTPRSVAAACRSVLRLGLGLLRCRPDVVNVHFVKGDAVFFFLLQPLFGYRIVLSTHGSDVLVPASKHARLLPRLLARADAVTAVADHVAERVRAYPNVNPSAVRVIPNGVDYDFWSASPDHRDASRPPTIFAAGRLTPIKGFDVLIEAFALVRERVPEARLVIAGDGEDRTPLRDLAASLRVDDAVEFTGRLSAEAVRARMAEAGAYALPSRSEGMPLALLEAMSAGVPPVATRVGGVAGVVVPGSGLLVPPEDARALADALTHVLSDRAAAAAMGRAAQERGRRFTTSAAVLAYEDAFVRLCNNY